MAIINQKTGYYGFTVNGMSDTPIDENGNVKSCIFVVTYPLQNLDVDFKISNGVEDWAAFMGDMSIIPLSNPKVLYQNRDNSVIQFDMEKGYPSNSPCQLVYRSDSANFKIDLTSEQREFVPNTISGNFAFTVDGYGGNQDENGNVNTILATFSFPIQRVDVSFKITDDKSHWGAHMGNGTVIALKNPEIIKVNRNNAIVLFKTDNYYPSNSPCVIVYRHQDASISVKLNDNDDVEFIGVTDIIGVPTKIKSGINYDLSSVNIYPFNASTQNIEWKVLSDNAVIRMNSMLFAKSGGNVKIEALISNACDDKSDFIKEFDIIVEENTIVIDSQPVSAIHQYVGKVDAKINVIAKSTTELLSYQWYSNDHNSTEDGILISGANKSEYEIPTDLQKADYYYYCIISSPGAISITTDICHIHVSVECLGIDIVEDIQKIPFNTSKQLTIKQNPIDSELPEIKWKSSNTDIIRVDEKSGIITSNSIDTISKNSNLINGNISTPITVDLSPVTISAETVDGKHKSSIVIEIDQYVSVSDISGVKTEVRPKSEIELSAIVLPSNANEKDIIWSIVDPGDSGVILSDRKIIIPELDKIYHQNWFTIKATIKKGLSLYEDYTKEFRINIKNNIFIPVTDIILDPIIQDNYYCGDVINLNASVIPINSSYSNIDFTIIDNGSTGSKIVNDLLIFGSIAGTVKIRATIKNGKSISKNFIKDFSFDITKNTSSFIPVSYVDLEISKFNPHSVNPQDLLDSNGNPNPLYNEDEDPTGENPYVLPITVYPANATNRRYTISLVRVYESDEEVANNYDFDYNFITIDSSNNSIYCDIDKMNFMMRAVAEIKISIENGIKAGINYEETKNIYIVPPKEPTKLIYIEDVNIQLPSPLRALYPVLTTRLDFQPWNYENDKPVLMGALQDGDDGAIITYFNPQLYDFYSEFKSSKFNWELNDMYLFPWKEGNVIVNITVPDGDIVDHSDPYCTETKDFIKEINLNFLPPFVPVREIINMPQEIILENSNLKYVFSPEFDTYGGYRAYNAYWDEETPSYTDIIWELSESSNLSIDNSAVFNFNSVGEYTFGAKILDGRFETIEWYGTNIQGTDYTQSFTINVRNAENDDYVNPNAQTIIPFLILTLSDGSTINITTFGELSFICSNIASDIQYTVDDKSFTKSDIIEITFNPADTNKQIKVTSLKNFACNCINLTKLNGDIPSTVTGDDCLHNFLRGCTSFNQAITIPDTVGGGKRTMMYFLRGCTSFNQAITIPDTVTGEDCLHGFLYGCTSFNQAITIPDTVTGEGSLERFLYGCTSFNQAITIPSTIRGNKCLRDFMGLCYSFNQDLTLPDNCLDDFMFGSFLKDCKNMCSSIYVPNYSNFDEEKFSIIHFNEQSFTCKYENSDMIQNGIVLTGPGASTLMEKLPNFNNVPRRNLKLEE